MGWGCDVAGWGAPVDESAGPRLGGRPAAAAAAVLGAFVAKPGGREEGAGPDDDGGVGVRAASGVRFNMPPRPGGPAAAPPCDDRPGGLPAVVPEAGARPTEGSRGRDTASSWCAAPLSPPPTLSSLMLMWDDVAAAAVGGAAAAASGLDLKLALMTGRGTDREPLTPLDVGRGALLPCGRDIAAAPDDAGRGPTPGAGLFALAPSIRC